MENVFMTTTERKRMSTKTTFKRIALVAVAALGLGVLSVAPSQAATDETLTLSASTATVTIGDTATVTITNTFISNTGANGNDSSVVYVSGAGGQGGTILAKETTDSANVTANTTKEVTVSLGGIADSAVASSGGTYTKQTITLKFYQVATAGTYTYTISTRDKANTVINKTATFTLTVSAADATGVSTKSLAWLNDSYTVGVKNSRADSALVVSAGTAASPAFVGFIIPEFRNASDTNTTATATNPSGAMVNESMTVVVSGPGLLTTQSSRAYVGSVTTKAKSVTLSQGDTVVVWSDGTAGVGTFTSSIGGVNLTQAAKTITFVGKPATITATLESTVVTNSGTAKGAISFIVKDSAANLVKSTSLMNTGTPGSFYAIWADTKVASGTNLSATGTAQYTICSTYNSTASRWECNLTILDSGTVSITIADSYTVASAVAASSAVSLVAVGTGFAGTMTLDKTSYNPGEKAILTLTSKDTQGNNVVDGASTPFASLKWGDKSPVFSAGGDTTDMQSYISGGTTTFVKGVDTAVIYMPATAGTYTLSGTTNGVDKKAISLTFTVVDPTKDAADAATDAALEATDAAYAAQDAAQLAAESADAATAAAEAATAAAEAATAAVEDLATKVAGLFADLQKQITTLANVVAKIAKKVKA